jgi:hypothetical protein
MTPLDAAKTLHSNLELAKDQLEGFLSDSLQAYIDFLPERGKSWTPEKHLKAAEYSFKYTDADTFVFETEEFYSYGDYISDTVELPFAFIEDPEKFKADTLQAIRDEERARAIKNAEFQQEKIKVIRRQLEVAERSLAESEAVRDSL